MKYRLLGGHDLILMVSPDFKFDQFESLFAKAGLLK